MWDLDVRLEGGIVTLEPLRAEHEESLYDAARPEEIWRWWEFNPARSRESFHRWVEECLTAGGAGEGRHFATVDAVSGAPLGSTSFCTLRPEDRGIEIGWTWLTPSAWGTGANVEAKSLMLRHAFEALGCIRVEFETDANNERSRAALAALPAQFEGVHRDDKLVRDGERRSSAYFSVIDSEWPEVKAALAARIAAKSGGSA